MVLMETGRDAAKPASERGILARIAALGTAGRPPRMRRRLAVTNLIAIASAGLTLGYVLLYAAWDEQELRTLNLLLLVQAALFAATPLTHRFGSLAAAFWLMAVWFTAMTALSMAFGRASGVQFYFLPGAAGLPLILGPRRLWLTFALTPVPLGLFLFIHLTQETPWLAVQADPSLISFVYMLNVVGAYMMILGALVYAFGQTRRAEDALELEYERSERLLHNLLPDSIAQRLKDDPEKIIADNLSQVTILFADIVDFTPRAASMDAPDLVAFLNRVFTAFDRLAERLGLEKIKTIGDAYMVAAGMPLPRDDHATAIAEMALGMIEETERISRETGEWVSVRVGLHTGPAVAGVIGTRKFFYDVWGDTVNTAARMESHGMPGKIQVTEAARAVLADAYSFEKRGEIDVKGKGQMTTWWLTGRSGA